MTPQPEEFELFRFRGSYTAISIGDCRRALDGLGAEPAPAPDRDQRQRCQVCHWPIADTAMHGCRPGNCCQRPKPQMENTR